MLIHRFKLAFVPVAVFLLAGCAQEEAGPSYADLVTVYNAELAALDRLEAKREKLVADYEAATKPVETNEGTGQLDDLLKTARAIAAEAGAEIDPTADPDALLDQLADRSGAAKDLAGQLLGGLGGDAPAKPDAEAAAVVAEPTPEEVERKKAFDEKLGEIDTEIADQKKRVERARESRDAAETAAAAE